jgi:pimeloyl-ACP methyl ester carboxylesterase
VRRIVLILVVAVLLGSCSGADSDTTALPATTQAAATGQIDGSFDVGGHKLHLRCEGTGSPGHRPSCTCMAWAATAPTASRSTLRLHALLKAAGVPGPYLLVGFSFGGLLAIMYAGTYPDQVMGLVSLDGSLPTDDQVDQLIPADERAQVVAEQEANQERVEFYPTVDRAKALVAKVPDVPVTYLAARRVGLPRTGR